VDECKPLPALEYAQAKSLERNASADCATQGQGLTLVHFSAQREHSMWDGGVRLVGCLVVVYGVLGGIGGCLEYVFVSEIAQVELRSGRV